MVTTRSPEAVPRHKPGAWLHESPQEAVLLDGGGRRLHKLNPTALAIWELCDGETTVEEMVTALCELFAADPEVVKRDVLAVFESFTAERLLDWIDPQDVDGRGFSHGG